MSGDETGAAEGDMCTCRVQLRCFCGETVAAEGEYGSEMDLATECGRCGRRHVVTITEVRGAVGGVATMD